MQFGVISSYEVLPPIAAKELAISSADDIYRMVL